MESCSTSRAPHEARLGTSVPVTILRRVPMLAGPIENLVYFFVLCAFWGLIVFAALGALHP